MATAPAIDKTPIHKHYGILNDLQGAKEIIGRVQSRTVPRSELWKTLNEIWEQIDTTWEAIAEDDEQQYDDQIEVATT